MTAENVPRVTPGEILAEELDARSWTHTDFANRIGQPARLVAGIISGAYPITPEVAAEIGSALDTGPELWASLQAQDDGRLAKMHPAAHETAPGSTRRRTILGQMQADAVSDGLCDATDEQPPPERIERSPHG